MDSLFALAADSAAWALLATLIAMEGTLIAEGFGAHVPKGYIYAAIAFSSLIEGLNMMARRATRKREKPALMTERPAR